MQGSSRRLCITSMLAAYVAFGSAFSQAGAADMPEQRPYQIGPEDLLEISVWKEDELTREVLVRPDGGISFPLAGDVKVAGRTIPEVKRELTERIREYIPGAVVTVATKTIAGYRIYVIGQVSEPGQYSVGRYVDVVQALTLAGGLTRFANEDEVKVIRRTADGDEVFGFDYSEVRAGRDLGQNILLQSGDVVVVP